MTTPEEREVLADEQVGDTATGTTLEDTATTDAEQEQPEEEPKTEYIEFVGTDPQYGVEFHSEHTVTRKQLRDAWGVETSKDLKWTKQDGGPLKGRMLVPVADMSPEAAEGLANDPMFKRVTL